MVSIRVFSFSVIVTVESGHCVATAEMRVGRYIVLQQLLAVGRVSRC